MKKIAIYSGAIPSTTFIERLIEGIASSENKILLFGYQEKSKKYPKNIVVHSYSNKFQKLFILIKYSILLFLFQNKEKQKIDKIIKEKQANNNLNKIKYYPVLYYKPDIFHLQWAKSVEDWIWVQDFGIKLILSLRGTHITISPKADENLHKKYQEIFPKIDGFHAVSQSMKNKVLQYGIHPDKIKVVYSGLDFDKLNFNNETKNDKLKIISIGRSHWVKGYNYALDACKILYDEKIDFQYTIIGVDNNEELIFQRNQLQLDENVVFEKHLSFSQIIDKIHSSDIVLLSSIEEGIANVVLEAMALGTVVVSTNCGGMSEIITDNENGFLVPVRNAEAIAEKIIFVNNLSNDKLTTIKNNARKTVELKNNIKNSIQETIELYNQVLNKE
jgi:glycosyltransferase involved in cell wall biosynthesis